MAGICLYIIEQRYRLLHARFNFFRGACPLCIAEDRSAMAKDVPTAFIAGTRTRYALGKMFLLMMA